MAINRPFAFFERLGQIGDRNAVHGEQGDVQVLLMRVFFEMRIDRVEVREVVDPAAVGLEGVVRVPDQGGIGRVEVEGFHG